MSITIDLPPAMIQVAQEYASLQGTSIESMVLDFIREGLQRHDPSGDAYAYLMSQNGWLPDDYSFNREEANAR